MGKKVPHTFIARLQKRFRADSDGPAEAIECVCLKEKVTVFEEEVNPQSEIIVISDVMIGPLKCGMAGRGKWNVPNYWKIKKYIEAVSSLIEYLAKTVVFVTNIKTVSITN